MRWDTTDDERRDRRVLFCMQEALCSEEGWAKVVIERLAAMGVTIEPPPPLPKRQYTLTMNEFDRQSLLAVLGRERGTYDFTNSTEAEFWWRRISGLEPKQT